MLEANPRVPYSMPNSSCVALASSSQIQIPQERGKYFKLEECKYLPEMYDLQRGLRNKEFSAYFQPKFDLRSGKVDSAEVLARWNHPSRGTLSPANFVPLLKRMQLLNDLLFQMLEQGLALQTKLYGEGKFLNLAFNISLEQLRNGLLLEELKKRLLNHALPLSMITFEITEDCSGKVSSECVEQLKGFKKLGVKLSMDDFGTGYSSLLRLCQVSFDEIKLAGEFTRSVDAEGIHRSVIRSVLALARDLGITLVVEGIETAGQYIALLEMGAFIGQGFLCAQPMSVHDIEIWLDGPYKCFKTKVSSCRSCVG
ncbi:EAL domain-containing protein [Pseudomonas sp. TNT2022 ID233]|uniref:EAL domain-containing protein n=1 Tax=Pseudomonas aphyarum TaxID=2942629 RepID=UPI0023627B71|nr:EAL domain-containing protein [Pseudomonas aphyarum]MDD1141013.1 EAL domain-containing protein [Pseudomonas aphyarum]